MMLLKEVEATVKELDGNLEPDSDTFKSAVLMLVVAKMGDNADAIIRFTKFPRPFVSKRLQRMREQGILKDGLVSSDWFDEEHGGIAFWCDVAVVEGLLRRVDKDSDDDGVLDADVVGE